MLNDLLIKFKFNSNNYEVKLKENQSSDRGSVVIGGKSYSLKGSDEAIGIVKHCLSQLSSASEDSLLQTGKELKARMWMEGAREISLSSTDKTRQVGLTFFGETDTLDIPAVINEIGDVFRQHYISPEIAEKCIDYLNAQLAYGVYDVITDIDAFSQAITADLRFITEDKHIQFYPNTDVEPENVKVDQYSVPDVMDRFAYKADSPIGWMGAPENKFPYEIMTGFLDQDHKIAYCDMRIFGTTKGDNPMNADAALRAQKITEAVQNIKGAESVIIDLRNNSGGDPSTVQLLCSLFIDEGLPLNTIVDRVQTVEEYHTLSREVLPFDQRMTEARVCVLISPQTASAAEEFANDIKALQRGMIVGEPSTGAANPGGLLTIGDGDKFILFMPNRAAYNPLQESNWEGLGVTPDHVVPANEAHEEALRLLK